MTDFLYGVGLLCAGLASFGIGWVLCDELRKWWNSR